MRSLDVLMKPRSIAIIGASADVTRIGGRPIRYLREGGFAGAIYPISASRDEVQGLRAYRSVEDVPGEVDCAVLALPTDAALGAIQSCARKGVGGVVVLSAGFAEMGDEGRLVQDQMLAVGRAHDMRLLGPNCLGMYNLSTSAYLTFTGAFDDVKGTNGRLGIVSQSGGYAGELVIIAKKMGLTFGSWVTTGNEMDIEAGEVIRYFADSPDVDVITAYLEGIRSRDSFIAGLEAAKRNRKPVIVMKVGRSEQGAKAAAAHTASLAGSDAVYDAVLERYGAYRARTTEEMLDIAYAASRGIFPKSNRVVILTASGGIGVQATDFAEDEGLNPGPVPEDVRAKITEMVPNAATQNPIDLTGALAHHPELFAQGLEVTLESGAFDMAYMNIGVLAGLAYAIKPLVDSLSAAAVRFPDVPKALSVLAPPEAIAAYEAAGYLQFGEPARALRALAALGHFPKAWDRPLPIAPDLSGCPRIAAGAALSEAEAKALLAQAGVAVPTEYLVQDAAGALAAGASIGRQVAIKVVSADLPHKTDVGGVALDVAIENAGTVLETMASTVAEKAPHAKIEGYLVTPMLTGGVECFVGVRRDPLFGPVVVFGLGGVAVELYRDVTSRLAPVDEAEALDMIDSVKGSALLKGFRGRPKADCAALAKAIVSISNLALANAETVDTIEVNPLLVLNEGEGVVALDAVITR